MTIFVGSRVYQKNDGDAFEGVITISEFAGGIPVARIDIPAKELHEFKRNFDAIYNRFLFTLEITNNAIGKAGEVK